MSLNMKTLTQALAKIGAVIEKTVHTTVQEVTGPRPLQDYDLIDQAGSGGHGLVWRLFSARPRASAPSAPYPLVTVWLLDKRALSELAPARASPRPPRTRSSNSSPQLLPALCKYAIPEYSTSSRSSTRVRTRPPW